MIEKTRFEWDEHKNEENAIKHGISFYQAQNAFLDPRRVIVEDLLHSREEERFFCLGLVEGDIVTVRFTYRRGTIRILGAGFWRKGKRIYERKNRIHTGPNGSLEDR